MAALVSVLIPAESNGCPHRTAALEYVTARYLTEHPDWQLVTGRCPGPWTKAIAVHDALDQADGDLLVIADADVWSDHLADAVDLAPHHPWVIPHLAVHRLTPAATTAVLAGGQLTDALPTEAPPYKGWAGGGITVLARSTYERIPLDRRFVGWGQEDSSWALALTTLTGEPARLRRPLFHLWHPPAARETRRIGSAASAELERRYIAAARQPARMTELLEEAT